MKEVEVKLLEINKQKIAEKLTALNAIEVFDGDVCTLFLDYSDHRIHLRRDVLRLRKEKNTTELTYKKVRQDKTVKVAEETSVQISDLDAVLSILQNLGLSVTMRMDKHRNSYKLGKVRIDIDKYQGEYTYIPEFLEIEGPQEEIGKYAVLLGFEKRDCLPWSTDDLIKHYSSKEKK